MTRVGKIARLPRAIREELNRRLDDGETGVKLVQWLNTQSEVQDVMRLKFGGRPVSEQNMSEWKQGGHVDWKEHRESVALVRELAANAEDMFNAGGESLADMIVPLLACRYAATLKRLGSMNGDSPEDWKLLRGLCSDVVALRKGDHSAERLRLERERVRLGLEK